MASLQELIKKAKDYVLGGINSVDRATGGFISTYGPRAGNALNDLAANPAKYSYANQLSQGNITKPLESIPFVGKPIKSAFDTVVSKPLGGIASMSPVTNPTGMFSSAYDIAAPNRTLQQRGIGAINTAFNAIGARPTPTNLRNDFVFQPLFNTATSALASQRKGENPIVGGYQGLTGERVQGVGDIITDNPYAATALNLGLPLATSYAYTKAKPTIDATIAETRKNQITDKSRQVARQVRGLDGGSPELRGFSGLFKAFESDNSLVPFIRQKTTMISDMRAGKDAMQLAKTYLKQLPIKSEQQARKVLSNLADIYEGKPLKVVEIDPLLRPMYKKALQRGGRYLSQRGNIKLGGFDESNVDLPKPVQNPTDPFFNVNRMGVDDTVKQGVADTIQTPEMKQRVGDVVGNKLGFDEIQAKAKTAPELDKTFTREQTADLGAQALALRNKLADLAQMGLNDDQYKEALIKDKAFGQYIARLLGQRRIVSDPAQKSMFNEIITKILKKGADPDEVAKASKGVNFDDPKQAAEFYRKYITPSVGEWADVLRYNAMLSSPNTQINNTFANTLASAVVAPVEKTVTGALDFLGSKATGKQQTQFAGEGLAYAGGYVTNLKNAAKAFTNSIKGSSFSGNPDLRDIPLYTNGKKAVAEKILKSPMKLMEATDQFFTALVEGGESAALKLRQSKGVNISDKTIKEQAAKNAAYRLYRMDMGDKSQGYALNAIDSLANLIQRARMSDDKILSGIAKVVLPFVRTPTNLLKQGLEYTPAGLITLPGNTNKTAQLSKAAIGSATALATAMLFESGRLTWAAPTGQKEKDEFYAAGMQPYAMKIGDNWVAYNKLPPQVAFPIALVAAIRTEQERGNLTDSDVDNILGGVAKYSNFFADQSFLKQIGDTLGAVRGDAKSNAFTTVTNALGQFVPFAALSRWFNRLNDPYQRQVDRDASYWDQAVQELINNLPFGNEFVPIREDRLGNPVKANNKEFNAISPLRTTKEDPEAKVFYDQQQVIRKMNRQSDQVKEMIKEGKDPSGLIKEAEASTAGTMVDKKFMYLNKENTVKEFDTTPLPEGNSLQAVQARKDRVSEAKTLLKDSDLFTLGSKITESEATKLIENAGLDPQKIKYSAIDDLDTEGKAQYVDSVLNGDNFSEDEFNNLVDFSVLTDDLVKEMKKQKLIDEKEAKTLEDLIEKRQVSTGAKQGRSRKLNIQGGGFKFSIPQGSKITSTRSTPTKIGSVKLNLAPIKTQKIKRAKLKAKGFKPRPIKTQAIRMS